MSKVEMDLAPTVNIRRKEIAGIVTRLRDLNSAFPDERKKPVGEQDPKFLAQRSEILARKSRLSKLQHQDRDVLRQTNRQVRL